MVEENNIKIYEIFWSVDNLKFADDILFVVLGLKKETTAPKFNVYKMPDGIRIIAFDEKDGKIRLHDSSLKLFASKKIIKDAFHKIKKMGYDCYLAEESEFGLITLSCFAPAPHRYCEIVISSSKD